MTEVSSSPSFPMRLLTEVLGTFMFLFIAFAAVAVVVTQPDAFGNSGMVIAVGFGFGLALAIFAFGHISGGHFNPAVTLGLAAGGRFPWVEVVGYWIAQIAGALIAAAAIGLTFGSEVREALVNHPGGTDGEAFVLEIVGVALFVILISAVATDERAPWSGVFAPAAIGGYIFAVAVAMWPVSGGGFNPARSIGPVLIAGDGGDLWIYLVAPLAGGAIGGIVYLFMRSNRLQRPPTPSGQGDLAPEPPDAAGA
ncbi:MAG: aquaporin [Thermoleophilia bacterium]